MELTVISGPCWRCPTESIRSTSSDTPWQKMHSGWLSVFHSARSPPPTISYRPRKYVAVATAPSIPRSAIAAGRVGAGVGVVVSHDVGLGVSARVGFGSATGSLVQAVSSADSATAQL